MSLILGSTSEFTAIATLAAFGIIAVLLSWLPKFFATHRVLALLNRGHDTSSQTSVRLVVLLLIFLLTLTGRFGLDVVLGAFVAGIIVRRLTPPESDSVLHSKVDGIAFEFFIPVFFVVSGATIDLASIVQNPLLLIMCFVLLFVCRGLPQLLMYRRAIPNLRERWRFSLYVATGLPIIIAVTTLEVANGTMQPSTASALVGAGALSVLVFPTVARLLEHRQPRADATA
jgi:Kef-type K+ transport system membrane component KefB